MGYRGFVALLLCGVFSIAHAQTTPSPWYVGAGLGVSTAKMNTADFPSSATAVQGKDQSGTAYKFFAGYRFNSNLAVEGSYANIGKSGDEKRPVFVPGFGFVNRGTEHHHTACSLWAIGSVSVTPAFGLFGKAGATTVTTKADFVGTSLPMSKHTKNKMVWGIGGNYGFTNRMSLRMEYEDFGQVGNQFNTVNDVGRSKVSAWSLGVGYRF